MKQDVFGSDIGGVVIDRVNDGTDTSFFGNNYLETTEVSGAFDALARLAERHFGDRVHLVSKCGARVQEKTRQWLERHRAVERAQIPAARVHFCVTREGKVPICRQLGITHFVDDRLEVLSYLIPHVPHLYLFRPSAREVQRFRVHLPFVRRVDSWEEILQDLLT